MRPRLDPPLYTHTKYVNVKLCYFNLMMYVQASGAMSVFSDINECSEDSNNCEQICVDTEGSFTCDCIAGFTLNPDNSTCKDSKCNYKRSS